jgi:mRNA-degrading endonuclease RelE of RelBE toxin-antitoxin system
MAKKIAWTDQARADVRAIDRDTAIDLLHGLARFVESDEGDVKRLQGIEPPEFRLRIGDYRVRFTTSANRLRSSESVIAKRLTAEIPNCFLRRVLCPRAASAIGA